MKFIATILIGFSLSVSASAQTLVEPMVTCSLDYSTHEADGVLIDMERGMPQAVTEYNDVILEKNLFKAQVSLKKVCAADGGPCAGFELEAIISKGVTSAYTTMSLSPSPGFTRMPLQLAIGQERAFVACEFEVSKPASKTKDKTIKLGHI